VSQCADMSIVNVTLFDFKLINNLFYFLIICNEVFLFCFQYMGSPYKRSIRLLGYYLSHII